MRITHNPDGSVEIDLYNAEDWEAFAIANEEELVALYGSLRQAQRALYDGGLTLGGGAAPLVIVTGPM